MSSAAEIRTNEFLGGAESSRCDPALEPQRYRRIQRAYRPHGPRVAGTFQLERPGRSCPPSASGSLGYVRARTLPRCYRRHGRHTRDGTAVDPRSLGTPGKIRTYDTRLRRLREHAHSEAGFPALEAVRARCGCYRTAPRSFSGPRRTACLRGPVHVQPSLKSATSSRVADEPLAVNDPLGHGGANLVVGDLLNGGGEPRVHIRQATGGIGCS
jgi:hypothetical protein